MNNQFNYQVTSKTLALIPYNRKTKIIEEQDSFFINVSLQHILITNCYLNNTSYSELLSKCSSILNTKAKVPLLFGQNKNLILFPTHSPRNKECKWLVLNNILNYHQYLDKTILEFTNHQKITIALNYSKFDKQVVKAMRLEKFFQKF